MPGARRGTRNAEEARRLDADSQARVWQWYWSMYVVPAVAASIKQRRRDELQGMLFRMKHSLLTSDKLVPQSRENISSLFDDRVQRVADGALDETLRQQDDTTGRQVMSRACRVM
jgi:hypothetical protein